MNTGWKSAKKLRSYDPTQTDKNMNGQEIIYNLTALLQRGKKEVVTQYGKSETLLTILLPLTEEDKANINNEIARWHQHDNKQSKS
jgi:hypothetical protein